MKLDVKILTRAEVHTLDVEDWKSLASQSCNINPFYEYWSLLPALKYLDLERDVFLVVASIEGVLVALFPIIKMKHALGLSFLSTWHHNQCFFTDPLCTDRNLLHPIIDEVLRKFKATIFRFSQHGENSLGVVYQSQCLGYRELRGSVCEIGKVEDFFQSLPGKVRSENKRIINRLFNVTGAEYTTSKLTTNRNWLKEYCYLESMSWKGKVGGAINSNADTQIYYREMCELATQEGALEFQGLFNQRETLAISFRITSQGIGFDLKTSYNELFKDFYPGVVLEIMNLKSLRRDSLTMVDSCTHHNNKLINRIWPGKRPILTSYYFKNDLAGKILKTIYRLKISR